MKKIKKIVGGSGLFSTYSKTNSKFKFIDLFAGIGGFHIALDSLGGECVFASEFEPNAAEVYATNFNLDVAGDIREIDEKSITSFDVLCAGFPCQPFSKGGYRRGFLDDRGTLFFDIYRIAQHHKPKFLLLENVANLVSHDNGNTYRKIIDSLNDLGYVVPKEPLLLSPHQFGVPVLRPRIFIPCVRKDLTTRDFVDIKFDQVAPPNIDSILELDTDDESLRISDYEEKVLNMWNDFYKNIDLKIIGFPVWQEYFKFNPNKLGEFPEWKLEFIKKNIDLYKRNKSFIDKWLEKNDNLNWVNPTHKKFEWQAGDKFTDIYQCLIQFRPSGVRVKKPTIFSTLVAINHSQIVGKIKRRLSINETKKLQSFPKNFKLNKNKNVSLKQLGNAVNVNVVKSVMSELLKYEDKK